MSDVHVFMLGATGFIGSAVFDLIYAKHPEYRYTALVRSKEKADELVARYPLTQAVIGDGSKIELLKSEVAKANIVISMSKSNSYLSLM
jgi:1-deoxy-D-xylulose 5-phosphate reductoisomerase